MKIYLTRHGQTNLNRAKLMQGRTDEPLNETGREQARQKREKLKGLHFDAVYASPLDRAQETAAIIGDVKREEIQIDPRLIETDFGKYEKRKYFALGLRMTLYWALPEIFPAPKSVESIASMVSRSRAFLQDLEKCGHETVLIACHGGIMRVLSGCLLHKKRGIMWRPKPHNCEIRVFEIKNGTCRLTEIL